MSAPPEGVLLRSPTHGALSRQINWLVRRGFTFWSLSTLPSLYGPDTEVATLAAAPMSGNLVSSLCTDGRHRVAVDIDFDVADQIMELLARLGLSGHDYMLTESSTPKHWHLYVDAAFETWDEYRQMLSQMVTEGIIAPEYYAQALDRRMTRLRRPGVRKG